MEFDYARDFSSVVCFQMPSNENTFFLNQLAAEDLKKIVGFSEVGKDVTTLIIELFPAQLNIE